MNYSKSELQKLLKYTELEYIHYVIEAMKEHDLTFAMFEWTDIEQPEKLREELEREGYDIKIENETFKIFWS